MDRLPFCFLSAPSFLSLGGIDWRSKAKVQPLSLAVEDKLWIAERLDGLTRYVLDLRSEVVRRFDAVDQRLEFLGNAYGNLDSRLPPMNEALIDFSTLAGQLTREQWQSKDVTDGLADRLTRLEEQVSKLLNPAA